MTIGSSFAWTQRHHVGPGELRGDLGVDVPPLREKQWSAIAAPLRPTRLSRTPGLAGVGLSHRLGAEVRPDPRDRWIACPRRCACANQRRLTQRVAGLSRCVREQALVEVGRATVGCDEQPIGASDAAVLRIGKRFRWW